MISKIRIYGFKSGVGYQLDEHRKEEKRHERYLLANEKRDEMSNKKTQGTFNQVLSKEINKKR